MLAKKIYVITTEGDEKSKEYFDFLCDSTKIVRGLTEQDITEFKWTSDIDEAWDRVKDLNIKDHGKFNYPLQPEDNDSTRRAECVTLAHMFLWNKIAKEEITSIIFEHDVVIHQNPCYLDIPPNMVIGLGYKTRTPELYEYEKAGLPKEIVYVRNILGAHAYALQPITAFKLLEEVRKDGVQGWIDCTHFQGGIKHKEIYMGMANPPPVQAWLRKSTIWGEATDRNGYMVSGYIDNIESPGKEKIEELYSKTHYYK